MSRDGSPALEWLFIVAAVLGLCGLAVFGCGSIELAAPDAGLSESTRVLETPVDAADAGLEGTAADAGAERSVDRGEDTMKPDALVAPLPLEPCAGLINPGPVDVVACSSTCATCTSPTARLIDCRFDGHRMCEADCSSCPSSP